jgi:hypothetical protein
MFLELQNTTVGYKTPLIKGIETGLVFSSGTTVSGKQR